MNTELKRIETALKQLSREDRSKSIPSRMPPIKRLAADPSVCSFTIHSSGSPIPSLPSSSQTLLHQISPQDSAIASSPLLPHESADLLPQASQDPPLLAPSQATSPELVLGLLKEIESVVAKWQSELRQIQAQVQALYQEGPIIEGWLESHPAISSSTPTNAGAIAPPKIKSDIDAEQFRLSADYGLQNAAPTGYCLHVRDAEGRTQSRLCPPEQIPQISLAIARFHKLSQLLQRKHQLERSLGLLVQSLVTAHACVQRP